ncbi:uncharacterized protein LOC118433405 [Folsomia candida]|uniref:uncharacterized protein LOC118433272 n=1 Tax=Folsomia candida TaxID=158441 RepID=UPI001604A1DE|nr:uncharacterized protein LOC118433272 [Folsomia candida]XP_035701214.1 uncharacterized protein LOC118433405 [Folsomia candida]
MFLICLRFFMDALALADMVFACFTMASIYGLLSVFLPCQPGLFSSIICTEGHVFAFPPLWKTGILIFFAILEFVVYMQVGLGGMYYIVTVLLTGVTFLWIECVTFIRKWEQGLATLIEYRKVQMFEKVLNACTRNRIFLKTALLTPSLQIFLSFAVITMYRSNQVDSPIMAMFLLVYLLNLAFTLQTFSSAAKVNMASQKWVDSCKGRTTSKFERKMHKSLAPLRLMFGNNFVEVLTPLVVQEFCVRQMMSFLVIMSK